MGVLRRNSVGFEQYFKLNTQQNVDVRNTGTRVYLIRSPVLEWSVKQGVCVYKCHLEQRI